MLDRATALQRAKNKALHVLTKQGKTSALNVLVSELRGHPELLQHPAFGRAEELKNGAMLESKEEVRRFIQGLS